MQNEKIQLILQYLESQGYKQSFDQLERESNIALKPIHIENLKQSIIDFNIQQIEELLDEYVSEITKKKCMLLILEQQYIQFLNQKDVQKAIELLRNQLAKYCESEQMKHQFASLVITQNIQQKQQIQLFEEILALCHRELGLLEPNRLVKLIQQAKINQILECPYHIKLSDDYSILQNHLCTEQFTYIKGVNCKGDIQLCCYSQNGDMQALVFDQVNICIIDKSNQKQYLEKVHENLILCIMFSPCNKYLASSSKDRTANIYKIQERKSQKLKGHADIVTGLAWIFRQNDYDLLTISNDGWLYEWNKSERKGGLKIEEKLIKLFIIKQRMVLISINKASIYDLLSKNLLQSITKEESIKNADVNEEYMLLNISYTNPRLELYSLNGFQLIKQFFGFANQNASTQCLIGWFNNSLIATTSDVGYLHIWHAQKGTQPIKTIQICDQPIRAIQFHPTLKHLQIYGDQDKANPNVDSSIFQFQQQSQQQQQQRETHGFSAILHLLSNMARTRSAQQPVEEESSDEDI